jgi:hypothetical protein
VTAAKFSPLGVGDAGEQVIVVTTGGEDIGRSVPDACRRREFRQVEAPRLGQGETILEPAVNAVTVGQAHALEVALLLMSCRERAAVDLGQLVIAGDLNAAGLEISHRIGSKPFDKRAIGLLSLRRGPKFLHVSCGHPGVPVQAGRIVRSQTYDTRAGGHITGQPGGDRQRMGRPARTAPDGEPLPAHALQNGAHVIDHVHDSPARPPTGPPVARAVNYQQFKPCRSGGTDQLT